MIALDVAGALFATVAVLAARLDVGGSGAGAPTGEKNVDLVAQARAPRRGDRRRLPRAARLPWALRAIVVRLRVHAGLLAHLGALPAHDARPLRRHHGRRRHGGDRVLGGHDRGIGAAHGDGRVQEPRTDRRGCDGALWRGHARGGAARHGRVRGVSRYELPHGPKLAVLLGPQTALMQEKVPPEYLGRVFGLYGAIMSWAMPLGLVFSSLFADAVGAPGWFVGAGAAMVLLACVTWAIPAIRRIEE